MRTAFACRVPVGGQHRPRTASRCTAERSAAPRSHVVVRHRHRGVRTA